MGASRVRDLGSIIIVLKAVCRTHGLGQPIDSELTTYTRTLRGEPTCRDPHMIPATLEKGVN